MPPTPRRTRLPRPRCPGGGRQPGSGRPGRPVGRTRRGDRRDDRRTRRDQHSRRPAGLLAHEKADTTGRRQRPRAPCGGCAQRPVTRGPFARCHDDALLERARDALVAYDSDIAISLITKKLLDAEHGPYLRERVARWLRRESPERAIVETVARICAGDFGARQPALALTRLRLAAARSPLDSEVLITAFSVMAERDAATVLDTIASWTNQISNRSAAIRSFLFLASSVDGARSLCTLIGDSSCQTQKRL